jgi:hypothetical protein
MDMLQEILLRSCNHYNSQKVLAHIVSTHGLNGSNTALTLLQKGKAWYW